MVNTKTNTTKEPIAIIGIGCRFPGNANSPETFWKLLINGVDAISEVPADRFDINAFYDPDIGKPGKVISRYGGFLKEIDKFDAGFFEISPREAESLDPQQRLLLEVSWEALEDAGQTLETMSGSQTGVFIGIYSSDYENRMFADFNTVDLYAATGSALYSAAGRLSYAFNLQGPSMAIGTACSSSLVSTHLALRSLRTGESDMALAGGVNLVLNAQLSIAYSKGGMLSPGGRCKFGDANADGFVRGEGCGIIILKLLSRALEDGDRIYALIKGSAVNNDGRQGHLLAPSPEGQAAVLRQAYCDADVQPSQVHYIEAHGTGTAVGDPVEIETLNQVLGGQRPSGRPCLVGSVKTNFGHLEAASGIAGLIKAALCIHHRKIPPSLHFNEPNPKFPWAGMKVRIPKALMAMPDGADALTLGVNAFGMTGMNAHVVLQEVTNAPMADGNRGIQTDNPRNAFLLPLSARSQPALSAMVRTWREFLTEGDGNTLSLKDICYSAATKRTHHNHRLSVVGTNKREIVEQLKKYDHIPGPKVSPLEEPDKGKIGPVFVFSGQGPQWFAMGRELYEHDTVYRDQIERCDSILRDYAQWSLIEELTADESRSRLDQTEIAQPAMFALQMGIHAVWKAWGVEPACVIGHSVGEIAAACAAGAITIEDALNIVFHRGRLLQQCAGQGKMAAVELPVEKVQHVLSGYHGKLSVAAVNSPSSVTISGETASLLEVVHLLKERQVVCRLLKLNNAFHSYQTEPYQEELKRLLKGIKTSATPIRIFSTVTGGEAAGENLDAEYWARNIRHPVQFAAAINKLIRLDYRIFLEISPHPVLAASILKCLESRRREGHVIASTYRGQNDRDAMLKAMGEFYTLGYSVDWHRVCADAGRFVRLPAYPWQRKKYWNIDNRYMQGAAQSQPHTFSASKSSHPLLGTRLNSPLRIFEIQLGLDTIPFLGQHRLYGRSLFPVAAFLEIIIQGATHSFATQNSEFQDVTFHEPLIIPETESRVLQTIFGEEENGVALFRLLSRDGHAVDADNPKWKLHLTGKLLINSTGNAVPGQYKQPPPLDEIQLRCPAIYNKTEFYQRFLPDGFELGSKLQNIEQAWVGEGEIVGRLKTASGTKPDTLSLSGYLPFTISGFELYGGICPESDDPHSTDLLWLPAAMDALTIYDGSGTPEWAYVRRRGHAENGGHTYKIDVVILNQTHELIAEINGARIKAVKCNAIIPPDQIELDRYLYDLNWILKERSDRPESNNLPASAWMHSPDAIAQHLARDFETAKAEEALIQYKMLSPRLDELCRNYILRTFRQLGWTMDSQQIITKEDLAERMGISEQYLPLLGRMLEILNEDGFVTKSKPGWSICHPIQFNDPEITLEHMVREFPSHKAILGLLAVCGPELAPVMSGDIDPIQLLFSGGSSENVENLYRYSPLFSLWNQMLSLSFKAIINAMPVDKNLRILEIGAGTGAATASILPVLPRDTKEYVFTDISMTFLNEAKKKFRDYPYVDYRLLDIEKSLKQQGYLPHQFDIIVAANVLHATADLWQTTGRLKELLASGGLLMLLEVTGRVRWIDLVFGLTQGWWRFTDYDLRPSYPVISADNWISLLERQGFSTCVAIPESNDDYAAAFPQAIVMGQGPGTVDKTPDARAIDSTLDVSHHWVIFADGGGLAAKLAERIRSDGNGCFEVIAGSAYQTLVDEQIRINPDNAEDYKRLINELQSSNGRRGYIFVYLWGLDTGTGGLREGEKPEFESQQICTYALRLVHALAGFDSSQSIQVWITTRGGQGGTKGHADQSLAQSPLWGLGRIIALEQSEWWGGLIDLDPGVELDTQANDLYAEISFSDGEDQVVIENQKRYVARLVPHRKSEGAKRPFTCRSDGAYLITGGLGRLGLKIARWMAKKGAENLILLGRRGLIEYKEGARSSFSDQEIKRYEAVKGIEQLGAKVTVAEVDVGDWPGMSKFFEQMDCTSVPLRGVIHAAAEIEMVDFRLLGNKEIAAAFRPKVAGAWFLHRVTSHMDLDFFVLFSSGAGIWGGKNLAHYAASNTFLDALAYFRKALGLPALTINWGWWAGGGTPREAEKYFAQIGLNSMPTPLCLEALGYGIVSGCTQIAVSDFNWDKFKPVYESRRHRPLLESIQASPKEIDDVHDSPESVFKQRLANSLPGDHLKIIADQVGRMVADILGFDSANALDPQLGFFNMGMDSIMTLQLKNGLEDYFGIALPATLAFEYPNIDALSVYLATDVFSLPATRSSVETPATTADRGETAEQKENVSEEELVDLLAKKLEKLS